METFNMSFKARNKDAFNTWRTKNVGKLAAAGIPEEIAQSNREFWFLVQEDWDGKVNGWTSERLSFDEAEELLKLLNQILPDSLGWDLPTNLLKRIKASD